MQSHIPQSVSHALRDTRDSNVSAHPALAAPADTPDTVGHRAALSGEVIVFPGHRPTEAQLRSILANTGPISVRHLKMEAGLTEDLLLKCVERLADAGLMTAEDRKDSNTLRLIVSATAAGRRVLAAGIEGSGGGESPKRGETG